MQYRVQDLQISSSSTPPPLTRSSTNLSVCIFNFLSCPREDSLCTSLCALFLFYLSSSCVSAPFFTFHFADFLSRLFRCALSLGWLLFSLLQTSQDDSRSGTDQFSYGERRRGGSGFVLLNPLFSRPSPSPVQSARDPPFPSSSWR